MDDGKEQRTIEIILKAQDANASIKEMGAGAAVMAAQLNKMGQDDPGRAKLLDDLTRLNLRLGNSRAEMRTVIQSAEELAAAQAALAQENMRVVVDGQKVNATFNEMKASASQLEKELNDLNQDDPRRAKMLADYKALGQRIGEVKDEMGQTTEKSSVMTQALAFAGVTVGAEAVLEGIKELGAEIINTTKEVAELRSNINTLTGATGDELDGLTTSVLAVSRSFGQDFNEVLAASNTLSKQMGVSQQEAMRLIEQGFLSGANAGGDFLDQVKEYAPQFKDAGFAAQDFIGHISQSATQGIFSDKGADVVKEFGLRIREQTKATGEAMQAAFGSDFTKEIFAGIKDGSMTVEQALQRVAKEMDETQIPANQLQTVIADVFGGPGEDAGIDYLKSLKNVGKGVDELVDKTNAYTQRQAALVDSNRELGEAQNALTKQFEGGSTVLDTLTNKGMTVLYTMLASLGATFTELFQPVQEIWKSFTELAESLGWVSKGSLSAKSAGELLGGVLRLMFTQTRLLFGVIADVVKATTDWAKSSERAHNYLQMVALPVKILYDLLSNGPAYFTAWSAGAESAFGSIGKAWTLIKSGDFSGAKEQFAGLGKNVGEAYRLAFAAAATTKTASAATTEAAGDSPAPRAQGGDGVTDADREKAAEAAQKAREKARKERKAAQDKADQQELDALKDFTKDLDTNLSYRDELTRARQEAATTDELKRREADRQKVVEEADKKYDALTGKEVDFTDRVQAILDERDLKLRELQAGYDEKDKQEAQAKLDEKLVTMEADDALEAEMLAAKYASGLTSEEQYQEQLYQLQRQGLEKRLKLLESAGQGETVEAIKLRTVLQKGDNDHKTKLKKAEDDFLKFKEAGTKQGMALLGESLSFLVDNLDKQTAAYQFFKAAQKTLQLAEIGLNLEGELSLNSKAAAKTSLLLGPAAGATQLLISNALSIGRAVVSGVKVAAFAKGGNTSEPQDFASVGGLLSGMTGGSFAGGGPVKGATIGLIGEAGPELVIPNWMYSDPKQANLMGFLEAQIASQGNAFATGGSTTKASAVVAGADSLDSSDAVLAMLERLARSHEDFRDEITDWQRNLDVNLDPRKAKRAIDVATQVMSGGGIR